MISEQNLVLFKRYVTITLITIVCFSVFIYKSAFKNGRPTCNNYVINVYLYLALGIGFVTLGSLLIDYFTNNFGTLFKSPKDANFSKYYKFSIASFILVFIGIFMMHSLYHNVMGSHVFYIIIAMLLSGMIMPLIKLERYNMYVDDALLGTAIIFLGMSLLYYLFPKFFNSTYGFMMMGLLVALFAIIVINLINIFILKNKDLFSFINYIVLVLFSLFVSYDTSAINMRSKTCISNKKSPFNPNYPFEALNFVLDLLNIFQSLLIAYGDN